MNERRRARLAIAGLVFAGAAALTCASGGAQATSGYSQLVTTHASAAAQSRQDAGREDPMSINSSPLGRIAHHAATRNHSGSTKSPFRIPPPPVAVPFEQANAGWVPAPPEKPHIADKVRVVSIMDDRAILSLPSNLCRKNGSPDRIAIGEGEQFNAVKVLHIDRDAVTVEEDGVRTVCRMGLVK